MGTGLRIGGGEGPGGGFGPGGPGYGPGGTGQLPYVWYLNTITSGLVNWFSSLVDPRNLRELPDHRLFPIQKNGQVLDVQVEQSSGVTPLRPLGRPRHQGVGAVPPLPREYEEAYLGIHLIFEHTK